MSLAPRQRFWILAAVLAVVAVVTVFFYQQAPRYRWDPNYLATRRDPYSTYVLAELLREQRGEDGFFLLSDSLRLPEPREQPANFLFIGEGLWLDSLETDRLQRFVRAGNLAFIASRSLPQELLQPAIRQLPCSREWEDYAYFADSSAVLRLAFPGWTPDQDILLQYRTRKEVRPYRWQYLNPAFLCGGDQDGAILGRIGGALPNFVELPYGQGRFLLHSTPLAFTNLSLLEERNLAYAETALAHLNDGPVYWNDWSKVSEELARSRNSDAFSPPQRRLDEQSPLQYILGQPALTWAWYLLLALGALHLVFRTKRRQRIRPRPEAHPNTSLEFLDTISRLYRLQRDHRNLARLQTRLFRSFIQRQYDLPGHQLDEELMERLARRSRTPIEPLRRILNLYRQIENADKIDDHTLLAYHRALEAFYRQGRGG